MGYTTEGELEEAPVSLGLLPHRLRQVLCKGEGEALGDSSEGELESTEGELEKAPAHRVVLRLQQVLCLRKGEGEASGDLSEGELESTEGELEEAPVSLGLRPRRAVLRLRQVRSQFPRLGLQNEILKLYQGEGGDSRHEATGITPGHSLGGHLRINISELLSEELSNRCGEG